MDISKSYQPHEETTKLIIEIYELKKEIEKLRKQNLDLKKISGTDNVFNETKETTYQLELKMVCRCREDSNISGINIISVVGDWK